LFLWITQLRLVSQGQTNPASARYQQASPLDDWRSSFNPSPDAKKNLKCDVIRIRDCAGIMGRKGINWVSRRMLDTLDGFIWLILVMFLAWNGNCEGVKGDWQE
jgi:hypothetical protein